MSEVPSKIYRVNKVGYSYLDDGSLAADFEHLALSELTVSETDINDLCVPK
jgi:hypothetical protein